MDEEKQIRFKRLLDSCSGIQQVLDTADEFIGHPIVYLDITYRLHAYSFSRADGDPLWVELTQTGRFSHETVDFFKTAKFIDAYMESAIALMRCEGMVDRINGTVYNSEGVQCGNICLVAYKRPFVDEDYMLAGMVCDALTPFVQGHTVEQIFGLPEDAVLAKLIEGKDALTLGENEQIQLLNRRLKEHVYVAVVDTIHYDRTVTHLSYFSDLFKRLKKEYLYFNYLNTVVVIMSADHAVMNFEKEMKELNDFFAKNNIFAGVSSRMSSLHDLKQHFKQALNTLNYGISLNCGRHIFSYDLFRSELFLNAHLDNVHPKELCHPIFLRIRDYDKRNKTEYLEFLNVFFACGLHARCAAKQLNVTAKEVNALLKDTSRLFEIDFANGVLLFALYRSIKLYKCFTERFDEVNGERVTV